MKRIKRKKDTLDFVTTETLPPNLNNRTVDGKELSVDHVSSGVETYPEVVVDAPVLTNRTVRVVVENHRGHRVVTEEPGWTGDT